MDNLEAKLDAKLEAKFNILFAKLEARSRPASPSIPAVSTIQQPTIIPAASMDLVETTVTDPVIVIPITTAPPVMQQSAAVEQPVTKRPAAAVPVSQTKQPAKASANHNVTTRNSNSSKFNAAYQGSPSTPIRPSTPARANTQRNTNCQSSGSNILSSPSLRINPLAAVTAPLPASKPPESDAVRTATQESP